MVLKYSFLRVLFEWSHTLDTSDEHSFVNVIGSLFLRTCLFLFVIILEHLCIHHVFSIKIILIKINKKISM